MFYKLTEFVSYSNIMSYPNTSNLNSSVKNIEEAILIIKNEVLSMRGDITKLKAQFDHQFGPHISENDMSWIEEDSHQTAISGVSRAIQRNRLISNPDYRGRRMINSFSIDRMTKKQVSLKHRYNCLLQILNKRAFGDNAPDLSELKLNSLRLELKRMARFIKTNFIDEDHPQEDKKWSSIPAIDRQYYQLIFEEKAYNKGFNIYLCKDMWLAKNMLQEAFKTSNYTRKRREEQSSQLDQPIESDSDVSAMSSENEIGSPIQEDVFTASLPETEEFSVESAPVAKRVRRRA
ncbi:hypothetical protein EDC94DRAFT_630930 [Helicostylum pulchrum]|nr:hypothetical protein EDC94DRAFT_630930 [Helicostylum pulchrum]